MFQNKKTIGDYKNFEETVGLDVVTTSMRAFVFVSMKEKITTIKKNPQHPKQSCLAASTLYQIEGCL